LFYVQPLKLGKRFFGMRYPSIAVVLLVIRNHVGRVGIELCSVARQQGLRLDSGTGCLPHLFDRQIKTLCRFFL
jgi:hypothetical protein